jgi:hypothetical protein
MPPRAGQITPLQNARRKNEQIVRAKRICVRWQVSQEQIGNDSTPANEKAVNIIVWFFDMTFAGCQIYVQCPSVSSTYHFNFLFLQKNLE